MGLFRLDNIMNTRITDAINKLMSVSGSKEQQQGLVNLFLEDDIVGVVLRDIRYDTGPSTNKVSLTIEMYI